MAFAVWGLPITILSVLWETMTGWCGWNNNNKKSPDLSHYQFTFLNSQFYPENIILESGIQQYH